MSDTENTTIAPTGLPEGVAPSSIKGLDTESLNRIVGELAKALSPGLEAAAEKFVTEKAKQFQMAPPAGRIAKDGPVTEAQKEKLVSEYFRHTLIPGYSEKARSNRGEVEKALAGMATPDLMAKVGLNTTTSAAGAELVATQYVRELVAVIPNIAPFRNYAHVEMMTEDTLQIPQMTTHPTASRKVENVAASTTSVVTAKKSLVATTQIALTPQISLELAADDRSNFLSQMALYLGRATARGDTRDFTIGSGSGEPQGIENISASRTIGMVTTVLTYDDIINMIHGVEQQYRSLPKTAFAFNNAGIAKVRKIKDSYGHPIFVDAMAPGLPSKILGYDVLELPDIPGDGTASTNQTEGFFACWDLFYWWGDRQILQIASDMSGTNFAANSMQLRGTTRSDGKIVMDVAAICLTGIV